MQEISLLQIIRNKKEDILKDIEDVDAKYDEGNGQLDVGYYTEIRDGLDSKLEVINEILNEYEKVKKPELNSVISAAEAKKSEIELMDENISTTERKAQEYNGLYSDRFEI